VKRDRSGSLFQRARKVMPGGVNSPVRAFRGVGGEPIFFARGEGPHLQDADGNRYVDFVGSWGPLILGHAHPAVLAAITEAARGGTTFGAPTEREVILAEMIAKAVPSVEVVRCVSSGSEATTAALRLARGATGRDRVLKFEGCYHGAVDSLLVKAGSGVETLGLPDSPGVPRALANLTVTLPFNDLDRAEDLFRKEGDQIACAIIEPVVGNMGVLIPKTGYLQGLQALCQKHGALFIVDEVMTGFRLAYGGAQALYGLKPDLSTFGKVVGGGMPLGVYGGRADLMRRIAPDGPIYQAGTLSGNPLATAAGIATLQELARPGTYERLETISKRLTDAVAAAARAADVPVTLNRVGSMWTAFFSATPVFDYPSAKRSDAASFGRFFHALLDHGVYLPPSQYEAAFVSLAHDTVAVAEIGAAFEAAFRASRAA
jgi:glutamate-1-semialdehyde 2,1-aminomutase